VISA